MKTKRFWIVFTIVFVVCVATDILSKYLVGEKTIPVIEGFFSFEGGIINTGAGWSVFSGKTLWLILFSVVFIAVIFVVSAYLKNTNLLFDFSIAFIIGGAVGNLFDRIAFGYVRDFIKLEFVNFPIFNFADIFLTVGVVLFITFIIFFEGRNKKREKEKRLERQCKRREKKEIRVKSKLEKQQTKKLETLKPIQVKTAKNKTQNNLKINKK